MSARCTECFLLPGGSDSRRVFAVDEPDEAGEYPVFVLDVDDVPCIELMYPGFDVYLADTARVITTPEGSYTQLKADRVRSAHAYPRPPRFSAASPARPSPPPPFDSAVLDGNGIGPA